MNNFFLQWKKGDVAKTESSEVPKIAVQSENEAEKGEHCGWCASLKSILLQRPQKPDSFQWNPHFSLDMSSLGFQRCFSFVSREALLFSFNKWSFVCRLM